MKTRESTRAVRADFIMTSRSVVEVSVVVVSSVARHRLNAGSDCSKVRARQVKTLGTPPIKGGRKDQRTAVRRSTTRIRNAVDRPRASWRESKRSTARRYHA